MLHAPLAPIYTHNTHLLVCNCSPTTTHSPPPFFCSIPLTLINSHFFLPFLTLVPRLRCLLTWTLSPSCCLASEARVGPNRALTSQQPLVEAPSSSLPRRNPPPSSSPPCLSPSPYPIYSHRPPCSTPRHLNSNCSRPPSSTRARPALPAMQL